MKLLFKYALFMLFVSRTIFAQTHSHQNTHTDSLISSIKSAISDTAGLKSINLLCAELLKVNDIEKALEYIKQAKIIYEKNLSNPGNTANLNGVKTHYANTMTFAGNIQKTRGNYTASLAAYEQSLMLREEINDNAGTAASYNNIATVYAVQGLYSKALAYFYKALRINEETGNKVQVAKNYGNIGRIYSKQKNYNEALKNDSLALGLFKELKNEKGIASIHLNVGAIYSQMVNYGKALENYRLALAIFEKLESKLEIASIYSNIGNIHQNTGNYNEALTHYLLAVKMLEELGDKYSMASTYNSIGILNSSMKKNAEAKKWIQKAMDIALEIGAPEILKNTHIGFKKVYQAEGNMKEALIHYKKEIEYTDSLINKENTKKTIQLQMQYDFDKKEAIAGIAREEKNAVVIEQRRIKNLVILFVAVGLISVLALSLFLINRIRLIRKQKLLIEDQKNDVERQKALLEEKQQEVLASIRYAKRIQQSLMATDKHISNIFIRLKNN